MLTAGNINSNCVEWQGCFWDLLDECIYMQKFILINVQRKLKVESRWASAIITSFSNSLIQLTGMYSMYRANTQYTFSNVVEYLILYVVAYSIGEPDYRDRVFACAPPTNLPCLFTLLLFNI